MGTLELPPDLQRSYLDFLNYPCNLEHRSTGTYPSALEAHRFRLDGAEPSLFADHETKLEVPIRDLNTFSGEGGCALAQAFVPDFANQPSTPQIKYSHS